MAGVLVMSPHPEETGGGDRPAGPPRTAGLGRRGRGPPDAHPLPGKPPAAPAPALPPAPLFRLERGPAAGR